MFILMYVDDCTEELLEYV